MLRKLRLFLARYSKFFIYEESDPVNKREKVLRRIPNIKNNIDFDGKGPAVHRCNFIPTKRDIDGVSVFRILFTSAKNIVEAGKNINGYYVASIGVAQILKLGFHVISDPQVGQPKGHALIPELARSRYKAYKGERKRIIKEITLLLAEYASKNLVYRPQ